jgi:RNA polymerase-binding protein DksA
MLAHYLSQSQLSEFKAIIQEKKISLISRANSLDEEFKSSNERTSEALEEAANNTERARSLAEKGRCNNDLARINAITNNFDDFGYCSNPTCGEEIGYARLKFNPLITKCIDCQEIEERK